MDVNEEFGGMWK